MATYAQIQTYAIYEDQEDFAELLTRYQDTLKELGCDDQDVLAWLDEITWPESEEESFGDIYPATFTLRPAQGKPITCAGIDVSLYPNIGVPTLDEEPQPWIGINLQFEDEALLTETGATYKPEVGAGIWHILRVLAKNFSELGVYFTEEWQENRSWRSIVEEAGDPWAFDLAIFPRKLAAYFEAIPAGYEGTVADEGFGFAQSNRWSPLPWKAAESQG
ncbi:hypothetical protein [Ktedonobacter racemifer]|uniref:Uncharacterized protein n=1 Tax=Ktedonobacter racemifer DSM 44963 TaxID=485913 RepID=D6TQL7_KTERA|nr:hypothetical protein [Ktedonobacter racemifer]EFH87684.1 hypothetical protein Krac_9028 [Ktedonobacter racemifer DSM 44963]